MKKALSIIALCVLFCLSAQAQRVIENPKFSASFAGGLTIERITLSDTATILHFDAKFWPGTWYRIDSKSYLVAGDKKLIATRIDGMPFNTEFYAPEGKAKFTITFPPVDAKTATIDFIESDCDRCFRIVDIELQPLANAAMTLPASAYGNWFKTDGTKAWVLTLNQKNALYNSTVWQYKNAQVTGNDIKLTLTSGKKSKTLYLAQTEKGLNAGESKKQQTALAHEPGNQKYTATNDAGFGAQIIKHDSVFYTGYLKGYSPKLGYKTGQLTIYDAVTGGSNNQLITVAADGSFSAKFTINHPVSGFVRLEPAYYGSVYMEPGSHNFHFIDLTAPFTPSFFMGDNAQVNRELAAGRDVVKGRDYNQVQKDIADLDPQQYLTYMDKLSSEALAAIDKYAQENGLSKKAQQILAMNVKARYATQKLQYTYYHESAYRAEHKIDRETPIPALKLEPSYFSFLNEVPLNDKKAVVSNDYWFFLNSLKYSELLSSDRNKQVIDIYIDELKKLASLTAKQKELLDTLTKGAAKGADYGSLMNTAGRNYSDALNDLGKTAGENMSKRFQSINKGDRAAALKKVVTADATFALQAMDAQDEVQKIENNFKPLTAAELNEIKSRIKDADIISAISNYSADIERRINANKHKTGFNLNATPKTPADSVFAAIMKKYKNKAVYVDFWATWCGPCRSGIERIAPLKEEMKDEKVAFVYITNQTSPEGTYNNMIPDIKGEHYRVSTDEWNVLAAKFNITGIPHYVLVDTKGEVADAHLPHLDNTEIKAKLLELASKN